MLQPIVSDVDEEMDQIENTSDLEADIGEEDVAGIGYDDDALQGHTEEDRPSA